MAGLTADMFPLSLPQRTFPILPLIIGWLTKATRRVTLTKQEILSFLKTPPPFLFCFVFLESFVLFNLYFSAKYFVDKCLSFFHWSLCCLFTPLDIFKRFLDFVLFSISFVREKKVITLLNIVLFSRDTILKRF